MRSRKIFALLGCCFLAGLSAHAQTQGTIRPAAKGSKMGAMGKDYVALPRIYFVQQPLAPGMSATTGLPAGVYRVKFEDDAGFYLPAPGKIASKGAGTVWDYPGGLYVRKDKPGTFYLYTESPDGKIVPPDNNTKLPYDFAKLLRQ